MFLSQLLIVFMLWFHKFISTFCYVGYFPVAPGTAGSIAAVLVSWFLGFNAIYLGFLAILLFFLGWMASHFFAISIADKDPKIVVIDEAVAIFLIFALCGWGLNYLHQKAEIWGLNRLVVDFLYAAFCFTFFRIFDILKPSFIGYIDKKITGGLGIMMDDVAAAVVVVCLFYIAIYCIKLWG